MSFAFKKYDEDPACVLARAWTHRMQYFYTLYQNSLDLTYEYTAEDVAKYQEEIEFLDLQAGHILLDDKTWDRCKEIKNFTPTKPLKKTSAASSSSAG